MSILMSQFNLYLWGINSQNLSFLGYMLLSHLQHTPTNTVNACRRKNRLSWEPLHHFTWSKWITGFKIDLYQHANFHPNHWRNDKVEILNGVLEAPQCKFLCNIKSFDSKAWRHMNMSFRSWHISNMIFSHNSQSFISTSICFSQYTLNSTILIWPSTSRGFQVRACKQNCGKFQFLSPRAGMETGIPLL